MRNLWIVGLVVLAMCGAWAESGATPAAAPPAGVSTDWWTQVQRNIAADEYNVRWQEEIALPEIAGAYQAPNRAHDLRTYFTEAGPRVIRRTVETPEWVWGLELLTIGDCGLQVADAPPIEDLSVDGNRIEYRRGDVVEWYVNTDKGLEQGFTINSNPAGGDHLVVSLAVRGDLKPGMMPDGKTVEFLSSGGVGVIHYGQLSTIDAAGKHLPSEIILVSGESRIDLQVDVTGAVYPVTIDPLATSAAWTAENNEAYSLFGYSVATAGDVNGDGYSDVIVGAPQYDHGQLAEGGAFVYHGSASGLSTTAAWTAEGAQTSARFGTSVSTAGDVNGDGYADVVVGAIHTYSIADRGVAYVYHGSASGLSTTAAWRAESSDVSDVFGTSVSTAGDVNGDGYDDVIVGAPDHYDGLPPHGAKGAVFVWYGSATGLGETGSEATADWSATSNQMGSDLGTSVSTAGDLNGDGYADIIVGAPNYDDGEENEGGVFVWYGSATGLGDAGTFANADWNAQSNQVGALLGKSLSTAGDVNGDGYAEVIVGAPNYDDGAADEGRAFVWYGSSTGLGANGTPANADWTAENDQAGAAFGHFVSTAGDANGDGYGDVIIGAPYYDNGETNEGRAYVYLGSASGLAAAEAWTAESNQAAASFGHAVSTAGDVNGDGYADVIVGAPDYDNGETYEGRASVYYGTPSVLSGTANWAAEINQADSRFGTSVSTAGDVNGDGYADVIVGASYYDNGQADEGAVFVYHGSASGPRLTADWSAESGQVSAYLGYSVSAAGDANGDGYADVIAGAPYYDGGQADEGKCFLWFGSSTGLGANGTPANADWSAELNQVGAYFGSSVSTAGDVNGDGYADVIAGAVWYDHGQTDEGGAFVYYGSVSGLSATADWTAESDQANAHFGSSVSTVGDANGDGYTDVIVGAPSYDNGQADEGMAFIWLGSSTGLGANGTPANVDWYAESDQANAQFGVCVSTAGDVNGDGAADVIVGAANYDNGESNEGGVFLWYGSSTSPVANGTPANANWSAESDQADAYFGASVSTAGDVNGDGYADIIVGAFYYDNGQTNEGAAFVWLGSSTGLGAAGTPANADWTAESGQADAYLGLSVSAAGDVNGDGYADVIVGAPFYDDVETNEGAVSVYCGNGEAGPGLSLNPRQRRSDDTGPIAHLGKGNTSYGVRLATLGRTPFGRGKVKLECEVKPLGTPFDGAGTAKTASWTDTGTAGAALNELVSTLSANTVYHWRVRLLYDTVTTPYQQKSRWFAMPWNGGAEADFCTAGPPPNTPTTPGATAITQSSIRWTWVDASLDETGFRVYADPGAGVPTTLRTTTAAGVTFWDYPGLAANVQHTFQVAATNGDEDGTKAPSFAAWTLAEACSGLTFSGIGLDTISVASANVPSNLSAGTSGLQFANTATAQSSAWQQDNTPWTSSGLLPNTLYAFTGQSRNGESATTPALGSSKYTLIEACAGLTFSGVTATEIAVASTSIPSNLSGGTSGLQFANATASQSSTWQQDNTPWVSTGLTPNAPYSFTGQSRNGDGVSTTAVPGSKYTLAATPSAGNSIACDKSVATPYPAGATFTFTNPAGFGTSTHGGSPYKANKFAFVWNTNPTYTFTGGEALMWSDGSITQWSAGSGSYYLHVQSGNVDDVRNPVTLDYGPFVVDADVPQIISVVPADPGDWLAPSGPTNDDNVNFAVTFNENIETFNLAAIAVAGSGSGVAQTPVDTGDHKTWTVTVAGITGDGDLSITVNAGANVKDTAGNELAVPATSNPVVHIDNTVPTPVITGSTAPANTIRTLTIAFGEKVNGFSLPAGMSVTNAVASNLQATATPGTYTVDIQGAGVATVTIWIPANVATDDATNPSNAIAAPFTFPYDSAAPTAAISLDDPTPTGADIVHFSVDFNETVGTSFTNGDVTVTGTLSGTPIVSGTGPDYTVALTLSDPEADGTVGISVGTAVTDLAGNTYAGGSSPMYTVTQAEPMPLMGLVGLGVLVGLIASTGVRSVRKR